MDRRPTDKIDKGKRYEGHLSKVIAAIEQKAYEELIEEDEEELDHAFVTELLLKERNENTKCRRLDVNDIYWLEDWGSE